MVGVVLGPGPAHIPDSSSSSVGPASGQGSSSSGGSSVGPLMKGAAWASLSHAPPSLSHAPPLTRPSLSHAPPSLSYAPRRTRQRRHNHDPTTPTTQQQQQQLSGLLSGLGRTHPSLIMSAPASSAPIVHLAILARLFCCVACVMLVGCRGTWCDSSLCVCVYCVWLGEVTH